MVQKPISLTNRNANKLLDVSAVHLTYISSKLESKVVPPAGKDRYITTNGIHGSSDAMHNPSTIRDISQKKLVTFVTEIPRLLLTFSLRVVDIKLVAVCSTEPPIY
ncbi:hypothetical protein Tco_0921935 [Tanacetum coccineum]|uniref:Uncharacterized protein n=1 Tax=Tanacetum coccineum TaxID=301880 RepID=A0ABQ5D022_9ASTR